MDRDENRPGYKKTKVGWIPNDWETVRLGSIIFKKKLEANYPSSESETGLPLIKMGNIGRGKIKLERIEYIPSNFVYEKDFILHKGDVLFNTRNTIGLVGKVSIWNNELPLSLYNSNLLKIEFKPSIISSSIYANFLFNAQYSLSQLRAFATGTTSVAAIYDRDLMQMIVPIPPLPEQKKVAEILSTWDTAIEQARKLIDAKKRRKKALMQQLLTGKTKLKGFEMDSWEIVLFGRLVSPVSRPVPKPDKTYLSIGLRSHCKGTFHKSIDEPEKIMMDTLYRVESEDLILNITFAWEGAIAFVTEDDSGGLVSHRFPTFRLKAKNADIEFVRNLILTKRFIWDLGLISPGGAGRNRVMNKKDFLKIKVYVPSIKSQKKIGQVLSTAGNEINHLEKKLKALEKQKRGLMQKLLTGEIRVK
jgi:type I restriction enzyme S subunit